jgi:glycerophosphoryl diester phosphodiesterase
MVVHAGELLMRNNFNWLCLIVVLAAGACEAERPSAVTGASAEEPNGWTINPGGDLNAFFNCLDDAELALVSAHRGGPVAGFPENGLETLQATMAAVPAIMEVDVATSADGVLFLMHDNDLARTTTGEGPAEEATWSELVELRLEDEAGSTTDFSPPKFADVLAWAKSRTILQIDFKRSARYEDVIDEIYRQGAEGRVILIAYSMAAARKLHRLAPDMMISLSIDSQTDLNRAVASGVPADRLLAFTGLEAPKPRLLSVLDGREIESIFGTLGGRQSIDNEIEDAGDEARYPDIAALGVDIIATDRPREAYAALEKAGRAPGAGVCGVARG